jgi:hypothetical protein
MGKFFIPLSHAKTTLQKVFACPRTSQHYCYKVKSRYKCRTAQWQVKSNFNEFQALNSMKLNMEIIWMMFKLYIIIESCAPNGQLLI